MLVSPQTHGVHVLKGAGLLTNTNFIFFYYEMHAPISYWQIYEKLAVRGRDVATEKLKMGPKGDREYKSPEANGTPTRQAVEILKISLKVRILSLFLCRPFSFKIIVLINENFDRATWDLRGLSVKSKLTL